MQADGDKLNTLNAPLGLLQLWQLRLYLGMMQRERMPDRL